MLFRLLLENPFLFFMVGAALVACLTFHEFAHAYIAEKLGDDTPRHFGRVTLNPLAHLDPLGTLLLIFVGFGWGKPVPFNPYNLKNPKRDSALIAIAGPLSNFIFAIALALLLRGVPGGGLLALFLYFTILYNLVLGVFNLIPFYPLDGFKVVSGLLPQNLHRQWEQLAPYGIVFILLFALTDSFSVVITPVLNLLLNVLSVT